MTTPRDVARVGQPSASAAATFEQAYVRALELIADDAPLAAILEALAGAWDSSTRPIRCRFEVADDASAPLPQHATAGTLDESAAPIVRAERSADARWPGWLVSADGLAYTRPILADDGRPLGTVSVSADDARDASDGSVASVQTIVRVAHRAMERAAVTRGHQLQRAALAHMEEAVIITDAEPTDGAGPRIRFVNEAFERMTGWARSEAVGERPSLLYATTTSLETRLEMRQSLTQGESIRRRLVFRRKNGSEFIGELSAAPIRDATGVQTHFVIVQRDVTERLRAEAHVQQTQRLHAVGLMAGAVAHDFNNVLTTIVTCASLAEGDLPADSVTREDVALISRAAARATQITRQLVAFNRSQLLQETLTNLNEVVRAQQAMLTHVIGEKIALRVSLQEGLATVRCDRAQLEQVLLSLATNALDAMPGGGTLLIQSANVELDVAHARQHPESSAGSFVVLEVSDTGVGMDGATMDQMFEPFFTTKAASHGTGLGLSAAHGIVRQSGGHLSVTSEPHVGTTVRVYLPAAAQEPPLRVSRPSPARSQARGAPTVLFVDDDPDIRSVVSRVFGAAGYHVLVESDGERAVEMSATYEGVIDVLITDAVLPTLGGPEVAARIRDQRTGIRILFVSGYGKRGHGDDALAIEDDVAFLPKPFSAPALLAKVHALLEGV